MKISLLADIQNCASKDIRCYEICFFVIILSVFHVSLWNFVGLLVNNQILKLIVNEILKEQPQNVGEEVSASFFRCMHIDDFSKYRNVKFYLWLIIFCKTILFRDKLDILTLEIASEKRVALLTDFILSISERRVRQITTFMQTNVFCLCNLFFF